MRQLLTLVASLLVATTAMAQTVPQAKTTAADADFVRRASSTGLTEIAMGKLAADQASSKDVKEFAARMVTDHTRTNETLGKLAGSKGLQIAVAPEPAQQQNIDRLKNLQGGDFDRAYSDIVVRDQKMATGLYDLEAEKGEDTEVRDFARQALPMLKEHRSMAGALPPL